jgi:hypothetical protein
MQTNNIDIILFLLVVLISDQGSMCTASNKYTVSLFA